MDDNKQFVHLHLHTEYSLLDGATKISKLFARCAALGQPAVAITDHGNMYGAMTFFKEAAAFNKKSDFKVKPIIGCEVYTAPDRHVHSTPPGQKKPKANHLILLCKNETGYHNLIKLVSLGFTEGLYYKPRIDFELLKEHHEGLVCLSACVAGELPQAILAGDMDEAQRVVEKFKALFGDDYYIEIQDHNLRSQKTVLPYLIQIARANNVKIVATNDVHYLRKEDSRTQKVLQCIAFGDHLSLADDSEVSENAEGVDDDSYFPTKEFYLKSREEMEAVFPNLGEALDVTLEIANKCGDCKSFFERKMLYPVYQTPNGMTSDEYLHSLMEEGLKKKYKEITPEIRARADYEFGIVSSMGFTDYFLVVWDFINYAESVGIPVGPGRGSGAGSIIAYAIGITKIEPLGYDLFFERFLNPERVSNPDFDIDFCVARRGEVIDYVRRKYGDDHVSQICTFGTMAAKAAIKDVGRVLNIPFSDMNRITKLMPKMMGKLTIEHCLGKKTDKDGVNHEIAELREIYDSDPVLHQVLDIAIEIEGMPRQTGLHAAGVIICRDPIADHAPLAMNGQGIVACQYNMIQVEELGLLKMDFLGLMNLTDIKKAVDLVEETTGKRIDFYHMSYDDPEVYKMIGEGDTHAVFQMESGGMKNFMKDLKPDCLEDLIAGISLYRPGPMQYIGTYVHNKRHPEDVVYKHPAMKKNLEATYGVMVYQEQVMNICRELAGYTMGGADSIRRMMSKKKHEALAAERTRFIHGGDFTNDRGVTTHVCGAVANGMSEKDADDLFSEMMDFASYAFNKSHAAAYAYVTYQTAYLKCHHLKEFIVAVLNNRIGKIEEITNYLTYLKQKNVTVLPPDINKSVVGFSVEGECVRVGLAAVKGVGEAIMQQIVDERARNGAYKDLYEFLSRNYEMKINSRALESLIYAGAFDCFGHARAVLIQAYPLLLDRVNADKKARMGGQYYMFDLFGEDAGAGNDFVYPKAPEFSLREKLRLEKQVTGVYLSGHPLQQYTARLSAMEYNSADVNRLMSEPTAEGEEEQAEAPETQEQASQEAAVGLQDGSNVRLGGMLVSAEKRFSKNGREFGMGLLEDLMGTVSVMVSPGSWAKLKGSFVPDKLVTVVGKVSASGDREPSVWITSIEEWKDRAAEEVAVGRKICCYVAGGENNPAMSEISEISEAYPGKDELYIKDTATGELFRTAVRLNAVAAQAELLALLGEGNVKLA